MLLVQEIIGSLISRINMYLAERLEKKDSPEEVLAEKNKKSEPNPQQPAPVQAKTVEKTESIDETWLSLPNIGRLKEKNFMLFQLDSPHTDKTVDDIALHFGCTWGQFMTSTANEFKSRLQDSLKKETLSDKKMFILARFKRHLILWGEYAKRVLMEREKFVKKKQTELTQSAAKEPAGPSNENQKKQTGGKQPVKKQETGEDVSLIEMRSFQPPVYVSPYPIGEVDEWLVAMVEGSFQEANNLLGSVLADEQSSLSILGITTSVNHGPGRTEVLINSCAQTITTFVSVCKQHHFHKMLDVSFNQMESPNIKISFYKQATNYLTENIFDEMTYHAYHNLNLRIPMSFYLFSPEVAEQKRRQVFNFLESMEKIIKESSLSATECQELFTLLHSTHESSNTFTPFLSCRAQKLAELWKSMHKTLVERAPPNAHSVVLSHRNCGL